MKRVGLAVALLILMLSGVIGSHIYLSGITGEMSKSLEQADHYAATGNITASKAKVRDFERLWMQNNHIMATFLRHDELDPINNTSSRLLPLLENNDKGEFSADCRTLETQLEHLWESERFTFDNIF